MNGNGYGALLDAMHRLMACGWIISYNQIDRGESPWRVRVTATRPGSAERFAVGPTITLATERLADRLAPGAR